MKFLVLFLMSLMLMPAQAQNQSGLALTNAWVREPPKGGKVAGGFVTITNNNKEGDRLLSASSAFSNRTEVHEMSQDNGIMRMRELPKGIEIKAGETLQLKPGSYHLMFMELNTGLKAGEKQKIELLFEKAGKVTLDFNVEGVGAKASGHMNH